MRAYIVNSEELAQQFARAQRSVPSSPGGPTLFVPFAGLAGVTRFMADQITNERLDFDHLLKMAFRRAVLFGAASRLDEAFDCLDQAIAFRDPALVHLAVAPQWDSLRGDRRFDERLKAMRLPAA